MIPQPNFKDGYGLSLFIAAEDSKACLDCLIFKHHYELVNCMCSVQYEACHYLAWWAEGLKEGQNLFKELHTHASLEPKGCHQQSKLGEAIANCFQDSLFQNKVIPSLWTSRLPAWENKCKFSVGFGLWDFLFYNSPKNWWQKYRWGSLPSIAQFSWLLPLPFAIPFVLLCRTLKDANRDSTLLRHAKYIVYQRILADRRDEVGPCCRSLFFPHVFPPVLSAGFLKKFYLYFVTEQPHQLPPTNKAEFGSCFSHWRKIPGPITVETPQFLGFVVLQHHLGWRTMFSHHQKLCVCGPAHSCDFC